MLGLESIFARSLLRNSSKCDLMWRWDADLKAAVHESRSACKQVRKDTENGHKMKKNAKKRRKSPKNIDRPHFEADLKAAVHESRSACKQVRK